MITIGLLYISLPLCTTVLHCGGSTARVGHITGGDEVLVSTKHIKLKNPGAANKLLPWIGPYCIMALVKSCCNKLGARLRPRKKGGARGD